MKCQKFNRRDESDLNIYNGTNKEDSTSPSTKIYDDLETVPRGDGRQLGSWMLWWDS